jgi:hypothetical protein
VKGEWGFGPLLLDDKKIGVFRDIPVEGIDDVDDRIGADLEAKVTAIEGEEHAVRERVSRPYRVERDPLSPQRRSHGKQERGSEDSSKQRVLAKTILHIGKRPRERVFSSATC